MWHSTHHSSSVIILDVPGASHWPKTSNSSKLFVLFQIMIFYIQRLLVVTQRHKHNRTKLIIEWNDCPSREWEWGGGGEEKSFVGQARPQKVGPCVDRTFPHTHTFPEDLRVILSNGKTMTTMPQDVLVRLLVKFDACFHHHHCGKWRDDCSLWGSTPKIGCCGEKLDYRPIWALGKCASSFGPRQDSRAACGCGVLYEVLNILVKWDGKQE